MCKHLRLFLACLLFSACAYRHEPIYNPTQPMPSGVQGMTLNQIEALIIKAGTVHAWTMQPVEPGHLEALHAQDKICSVVDITFDKAVWHIQYKSSTGFLASDGHIHGHYNVWIRNLETDIASQLAGAAK